MAVFDTLVQHPRATVLTCGSLLLLRWWDTPTREALTVLEPKVLTWVGARSGQASVVVYSSGFDRPPDENARTVGRALMARLESQLKAAYFVLESTGFRAAAVRAVLTGYSLVIKPRVPVKMLSSLEELSEPLRGQLRELGMSPMDFIREVRALQPVPA